MLPSRVRRPSRFLALACLSAAGALAISSCGSAGAAPEGQSSPADPGSGRIAFFTDALSNAYLTSAVNASKAAAEAKGVPMDVFSADFDTAKQLTQIEDAISSGKYKALVVEAIDGQSVCKPLKAAASSGTIVAIYNTPICGDDRALHTEGTIGYFGGSAYDYGTLLGQQMVKALDGKGSVGYISGPVQNTIVEQTTAGVKDALGQAPGINLVAELAGDWDAAKGLAATQDLVQSKPDLDGIVYGVDQMAIPSLAFLSQSGKVPGLKIVSLGATTNAATAVANGQMFAGVVQLPAEEAANATRAAISTMAGEPIDVPGWDAAKKVYDVLQDPALQGTPVLDKSTLATFKPEWSV
jgi:ribose transport system substrate-binding protein